MTQQLSRRNDADNEPWYGKVWGWLKHFPKGLAKGAKTPPTVSGFAAAALISVGIGCFAMMLSHHYVDINPTKTHEKIILELGSWIPGARNPSKLWGNIGSYAGKETMLLIGWLGSWLILHFLWKNKAIKVKTILFWMFVLMIASTLMAWNPLFPYMPLT